MTDTTAEALRDDYLARLDAAMRDVPHGIASDIRAGILEEFSGLDADAAAALIARLGDPETIAREAEAEASDVAPAETASTAMTVAPRVPATHTRGFAIAAALTLAFGGFAVPLAGWVVGVVLVCLSPLWRTWEKIVSFVLPLAVLGVSLSLLQVMTISTLESTPIGIFETGGSAPSSEAVNPLLPSAYDFSVHGLIIAAFVLVPLSGLWLLWRLRGRHPVT